jgi:hypothetical protein
MRIRFAALDHPDVKREVVWQPKSSPGMLQVDQMCRTEPLPLRSSTNLVSTVQAWYEKTAFAREIGWEVD